MTRRLSIYIMRKYQIVLCLIFLTALPVPGFSQQFPGDYNSRSYLSGEIARAEQLVHQQYYTQARVILDSALNSSEHSSLIARGLSLRATCEQGVGDNIGADNDYARIIKFFPDEFVAVNALRNRGMLAYGQKQYQESRSYMQQCITRGEQFLSTEDSTNARAAIASAWYWTGKSYAEYDQREEARRAFDSSRQ